MIHTSTRGQGHCSTFLLGHSDIYFQTYSFAAGHFKVNLYVEPLWSGGMKVCSNDGGYMAKMAALPQYFNTDSSKVVLLFWFLTATCSCCPYLYFGSAIMLVTHRATEILKSKSVRSTDDVIRTCVWQSQIVTKTNDIIFIQKCIRNWLFF